MNTQQVYQYCLEQLEQHDVLFVFLKSAEKSVGVQLEVQKALALGKMIVLALPTKIDVPELRSVAHKVIEYNSYDELYSKAKDVLG